MYKNETELNDHVGIKTNIINGERKSYTHCSESKSAYDDWPIGRRLRYLGVGMINGRVYHFWKERTEADYQHWRKFVTNRVNSRR
jgi:hypothetical protein